MPTSHEPHVGSISHGTMRTVDLLDTFACELEYLAPLEHAALILDARQRAQAIGDGREEEEHDRDCLADLFDALDALAPPYCYFGAHAGDGSDYGFWPLMEDIDDLPRIQNVENEIRPNDHGNVTVYDAAGNVILDIV